MDTMSIVAQIFIALLAIIFIYILTQGLFRRAAVHASQSRLSSSSRRLGKFEESMEIFSNERQGTTNSCYVMTLHSKKELKESLVRDALLRLAKRQPMLRAVIKIVSNSSWFGQNNESYFEIIEPNKIGDMIDLTTSDVNASQWQKAWYDIVMRPIKTGLLWRTVLFAEEYLPDSENYVNTIIFRVNHCIIDGVSGINLCKQFLSHLNSVAENTRVRGKDVLSLELLPSFYAIISTRSRSSWKDLQESVGLHFIYKFMKRLKLCILLAYKPEKPYPFFMTQPSLEVRDLVYKVFSETQTSQIRKVCRSKGVTVTGALVAAAHKAFCKLIRNQDSVIAKEQEELMHMFAVNGLRFCESNPPVEYLGNFLVSEMLPMSCNTDDFWSMAQEAMKQIHTIIREGKNVSAHLAELDIFTPREITDEFHSPLDPKKKLKLFSQNFISSVGAFTFDDSTSMYKLHECLYYSVPFGYASFATHFNTTVNGKMSWVITCSKFVPGTIEEQFATLCFDILQKETRQE